MSNYKIVVTCISLAIFFGCKKDKTENVAPNYTSAMGGTRNWHRWRHLTHTNAYQPALDTMYLYPDTSFAVTIVNSTTISFLGKNYEYDTAYSNDSVYYFGRGYYGVSYMNGVGVIYYPEKDSILFVDEFTSHNGINWMRYYTF